MTKIGTDKILLYWIGTLLIMMSCVMIVAVIAEHCHRDDSRARELHRCLESRSLLNDLLLSRGVSTAER